MRNYVFDTNAVVMYYTREDPRIWRILDHVIQQRVLREAALFIPSFCIVEVFNVFAKLRYERKLSPVKYKQFLDSFRKDLHWATIFYPYDLNRYHVLAADEIIPVEYAAPREKRSDRSPAQDRLSGIDILLIAMASELTYLYGNKAVFLLTGDSRIKRVCGHLRNHWTKEEEQSARVRRELGQPNAQRWPAPSVFDLYHDSPYDLPTSDRQKPLILEPRGIS